jgi:hypothetical protein
LLLIIKVAHDKIIGGGEMLITHVETTLVNMRHSRVRGFSLDNIIELSMKRSSDITGIKPWCYLSDWAVPTRLFTFNKRCGKNIINRKRQKNSLFFTR